MADASKDQNDVSTLLGVSNADGSTPVKIWASPSTHRLLVDTSGGVSPGSPDNSIQYNDSGTFAGSATLLFDGANTVTLGTENAISHLDSPDATTSNTDGGSFSVAAGEGNGSGAGGDASLVAGQGGATGGGGDAKHYAGNAGGGNGKGGDVYLRAGSKQGAGASGKFYMQPKGATTVNGILDFDSLASTDKTFTFPNASGTISLGGVTTAQYQSATYVVSSTAGQGQYTDIQTAIDALPSTGGLIFVRAGTYTLAASINIKVHNTQIVGEGLSTIIQFDRASVTPAIKFNATDLENCALKNFELLQTNGTAGGVGISCGNQPFLVVDQLLITACATGIDINDTANLSFYSTYSNLVISACSTAAISLRGNPVNDNVFSQIRTQAPASAIGLDLQVGNGNTFINFDAEPSSSTGTTGVKIANSTSNYSNTFIGVFCEGNATGLNIVGSNAAGNLFIGGEFTGNTADISDGGTNTFFQNVAVTVGQRGVQVNNETPSGTVNGSNTVFTLAHAPSPTGSLQLFADGAMQQAGGGDYTLSSATITFNTAPLTGTVLIAYYRY